MPRARLAACLLVPLLLGAPLVAPRIAAAQAGDAPLAVVVEGGQLRAELPCPASATPTATIDGAPVPVAAREPAAAPPVALALVLDTGPAMAAAGTPHSTRLDDARTLATALLDRVPPGSLVALVGYDLGARLLLPLTAETDEARRALAALVPLAIPAPERPRADAAAEALRLADQALQGAPLAARAVVLFSGGDGAQLPALGGPPPQLIVAHAAPPDAEERETALPFVAASAAELPGLMAAFDRRAASLLGGERVRLSLPIVGQEAGDHTLTINGCGAARVAAFTLRPGLLATLGPGAVALGCGGVAVALWRRLRPRRRADRRTQRLPSATEVTTARRGGPPRDRDALSVELWDGAERRVVRLTGRQCSVGRDAGCDVVVANEWVSGLHARLTRSDAGVEITDLGSTNGTWLGEGERYLTAHTPVPLAWGQVVLIGREVRLALLHPDEETAGEAGAAL